MAESTNTDGIPVKSALAVAVSMAVAGHSDEAKAQEDGASSGGLEEITVTARKQEESLQDVPVSIQAFTGSDLKRQGIANFEDAVRFLPSVSSIGGGPGASKIIFRGVSDNPNAFIAASSAALYIDEQPLTQFTINPEPRMVDIERIEALAGPQGTLYGDSSQSGTMRIITNKPDPTEFAASAEVMLRTGSDSATSYDVNGMLNLPLIEDKFAIRLVGFSATDGGFVDNVLGVTPVVGGIDNSAFVADDVNESDYIGGRISAKWFINDDWSATLGYIQQKSETGSYSNHDPSIGDLKVVRFFNEFRDDEWSQASLTLEGRIGNIDIVSNTSYFDREVEYSIDRTIYSSYWNYNFCVGYFSAGYCWSGTTFYDQDTVGYANQPQDNDRFTQEIRLSQSGDNYRWVLGAFYERKTEHWEYRARVPESTYLNSLAFYYWTAGLGYTPSGVDPSWWLSVDDTLWEQWAVFGNFSYDFNEQWSAEVGYRYFDQDMEKTYFVDKPFITAPGVWPDTVFPKGGNKDTVPKVSVTYRVDDERMIYALYSEGFRAGGANRNRVAEELTVFPVQYEPDLLKNFEVGAKTRWLNGRLQINATAFFGDWENYQIEALDPSFAPCQTGQDPSTDPCGQPFQVSVINVGNAEQQGLEVEVRAAPDDALDLGLNFTLLNAETSEDFFVTDPDNPVPKGSRLPNVPEFKYGAYAQYTWPVNWVSNSDAYVRAQYTYQGDSLNQLETYNAVSIFEAQDSGGALSPSSRDQVVQPSYGIADLKAGLTTDAWSLELFINNISDERAVLYDNDLSFDPYFGRKRVLVNRPREYGIRFSHHW